MHVSVALYSRLQHSKPIKIQSSSHPLFFQMLIILLLVLGLANARRYFRLPAPITVWVMLWVLSWLYDLCCYFNIPLKALPQFETAVFFLPEIGSAFIWCWASLGPYSCFFTAAFELGSTNSNITLASRLLMVSQWTGLDVLFYGKITMAVYGK